MPIPLTPVPRPEDGLALELAMLEDGVVSGKNHALIWQADTHGLVLPDRFTRDPLFTSAARASARRGWPVVGRKTGGGITPQGPGVLNLALCFTVAPGQSRAILPSYAKIVDPLRDAFARLSITAKAAPVEGSFCDGDYNLAVDGRKIVGTAQRWRGRTCLIHALILTDIDLDIAVAAVADLSRALGHDTVFDRAAHCRLADLMPGANTLTETVVAALDETVTAAGYAPFSS
ncbi:MAG: lipoate--protein ligase family protein [Pseudomonadota bacterium]